MSVCLLAYDGLKVWILRSAWCSCRPRVATSAKKVTTERKTVQRSTWLHVLLKAWRFAWSVEILGMICFHAGMIIHRMIWRLFCSFFSFITNLLKVLDGVCTRIGYELLSKWFFISSVLLGDSMLCLQDIWPLMLCQYCWCNTGRNFLLQMWSDGSYWFGKFNLINYI
jgi:hypothetical protein